MRTVFTNSQCAHVWAQRSQPYGRSQSMKFGGPTLYSYRAAIARIVDSPRGPVVLINPRKYSMTTSSKHMPAMHRAVGHYTQFVVPDLSPVTHTANVDYLRAQYASALATLMRAPVTSYRLEDDPGREGYPTRAHETLADLARTVAQYAERFELGLDPLPWQADADAAIARRDRLVADPKRAARLAKSAAKREEMFAAVRAARLEADRIRNAAHQANELRWAAGDTSVYPAGYRDPDTGAMPR